MKMLFCLLTLAAAAPAAGEPPQRRADQVQAFEARREGRLLPLREIEGRVVPQMGSARYLGAEFDGGGVYTLKFLRDGTVIWVEVDGRSGQVIGRSGR